MSQRIGWWLGLLALSGACAAQTAGAPASSASAPAAVAAPTAPAEPAFDIWEYQVEGNTVLPVEAIERAVLPYLGPAKTMRQVEDARNALETVYQQAGYLTVLVDIPEQKVDDGIVRLSVLQGALGHLYVTGSRYHSQGYIRASLPGLVEGTVPNFTEVQQQLGTVNRSDDRRVAPIIKPGRLPGTVDMELQVADSLPLGGSVELNNQHAAGTTAPRLSGTLRYDNLFQRDHSLALTLQTAPEKPSESRVAVLNYTIPLPEGEAWTLSATFSNSKVDTLGGTQALGDGRTYGLRRLFNFSNGGGFSSLSVGADLKLLRDQITGTQLDTPVHYVPFQLAYNGQWNQDLQSLQIASSLSFAWSRILQRDVVCAGAYVQDQFDCKTQGASGSFGVYKLDGRWSLPVGPGSFVTRLAGQIASGPLVSAEQFALGGADTVRGYFESEVSGDNALLGSLEWRAPNLAGSLGMTDSPIQLRPQLFVDLARGYLIEPGSGQSNHSSLWGAGLGLRASAPFGEGALDLAWPGMTTVHTEKGQLHVHARLLARF